MNKKDLKAKVARHLKIVEWSDEDKCFVGRVPGLFTAGVHGPDETEVYRELCQATDEWIEIIEQGAARQLRLPEAGAFSICFEGVPRAARAGGWIAPGSSDA